MKEVKLHLDPTKHRKLMYGNGVQLSIEYLTGERGRPVKVMLPDKMAKKIEKAKREAKGVRISIPESEIEGSGIKEFFGKVKKGIEKGKKFYDENIKSKVAPKLRQIVEDTIEQKSDMLGNIPIIGKEAERLAKRYKKELAEKIGDVTGAYGMCLGSGKPRYMVYDTWSPLSAPLAPAMNPGIPSVGFGEYGSYEIPEEKRGRPKKVKGKGMNMKGGSFRVI